MRKEFEKKWLVEVLEQVPPPLLAEVSLAAFRLIRLEMAGAENLRRAKEHLADGSLLFYINHASHADPAFFLRAVTEKLKGSFSNFAFFASYGHLDQERRSYFRPFMISVPEKVGLTLIPVVQFYEQKYYPHWRETNLKAVRTAIKILNKPGGVLAFAPEGTRSESGKLQAAQEGIIAIIKRTENLLILPVGIIGGYDLLPKQKFLPRLWRKVKVVIGKPMTSAEVIKGMNDRGLPAGDFLMVKLGELLPLEQSGAYRNLIPQIR